jgi:hypothetical protein
MDYGVDDRKGNKAPEQKLGQMGVYENTHREKTLPYLGAEVERELLTTPTNL